MADLGKVSIVPKGEWIVGVAYETLDVVTHNLNLYIALKDNAVEPTNDGINWQLLVEGVPIATISDTGKSKPDGKTITIDADGTLHGASQVPEGVTYVDLQSGDAQLFSNRILRDSDTLEGHSATYFATKSEKDEVANNKELILRGTTPEKDVYIVNKLDDAFLITTPTGIMISVPANREIMRFLKNSVFEYPVSLLAGASIWGIDITKSSRSSYLAVNNGINVGATYNEQLLGGGIVFLNSPDNGVVQKIVEYGSDGYLHFLYGNEIDGYKQSAQITSGGKWHFFQDIVAPSVASTTDLLSAQQDITEADLQNIELQQKVANLEEKLQKLTGGDNNGETDY